MLKAYLSIRFGDSIDAHGIDIDHFSIQTQNLNFHRLDTVVLGECNTVAHPEITVEGFPFLTVSLDLSFLGNLLNFHRLECGHLPL